MLDLLCCCVLSSPKWEELLIKSSFKLKTSLISDTARLWHSMSIRSYVYIKATV